MPNNRRQSGVEASKALKLAHEAAIDTWLSRKELPKSTIYQLHEYSQQVLKMASVLAFVVRDASEDVTKPVEELTETTSTFLQALYNLCGTNIDQHQTTVANLIKTAATNVEQKVAEFITAAMQHPVPPNLNVFVGKISEMCAQACATPTNNIEVAIRQIKIAVKQIESAKRDFGNNNEISMMDKQLRGLHTLTIRLLDHILDYLTAVLSETVQLYENSISNSTSSSSSSSQEVFQFPDVLGQRAVSNLSETVDHLASEIDIIDVITNEDVSNIMITSDLILSSLNRLDKLVKKAGFERKEVIDVSFAVLELREYAKASPVDEGEAIEGGKEESGY